MSVLVRAKKVCAPGSVFDFFNQQMYCGHGWLAVVVYCHIQRGFDGQGQMMKLTLTQTHLISGILKIQYKQLHAHNIIVILLSSKDSLDSSEDIGGNQ